MIVNDDKSRTRKQYPVAVYRPDEIIYIVTVTQMHGSEVVHHNKIIATRTTRTDAAKAIDQWKAHYPATPDMSRSFKITESVLNGVVKLHE